MTGYYKVIKMFMKKFLTWGNTNVILNRESIKENYKMILSLLKDIGKIICGY